MSIINDALKKVQTNIGKKETKRSVKHHENIHPQTQIIIKKDEQPNDPIQPSELKNSGVKKLVFFSLIFIPLVSVITLIIFVPILIKYIYPKIQETPLKQTKNVNIKEKAVSQIVNLPLGTISVEKGSHNLTTVVEEMPSLSGIMMIGDKKVAVLDNDVYSIGDLIYGMEIIDIQNKTVRMKKDGKTITLDVRNAK